MYTLSLVNINLKKELKSSEFETSKEAKKAKRKMMKEYDMINHGGYFVNYESNIELLTNF